MKKISLLKTLCAGIALFAFSACSTMKELGIASPSVSFQNVAIKSLDFEGITFTSSYSVSNPYPVSFSIKQVAADILCGGSKFTSLSADEGVSVAAMGAKSNSFSFKIPYDAVLNLAKSAGGQKSLPFTISGNASLDLDKIPFMKGQTMTLPFTKSFDVPVFKPELSLSNPQIVLPSLAELKDAFTSGGMSVVKAALAAGSIAAGKQVAENIFDGVDLNLKCNFNLNVANAGSAAWKYALKNCSINTGSSNSLINLAASSSGEITSSSGTIPLTATLSTLTAGKFIAQILNKKGADPTLSVESALSFPELSYAADLPLNYSKEIPISSFRTGKN